MRIAKTTSIPLLHAMNMLFVRNPQAANILTYIRYQPQNITFCKMIDTSWSIPIRLMNFTVCHRPQPSRITQSHGLACHHFLLISRQTRGIVHSPRHHFLLVSRQTRGIIHSLIIHSLPYQSSDCLFKQSRPQYPFTVYPANKRERSSS
jgi:hypothetical protein